MSQIGNCVLLAGSITLSLFAQQPPRANPKPAAMQAQSASTVSLTAKGDEQTLAITNVAFEVTGDSVPGRPNGERLLLRKTAASKQVLGDMGLESVATVEAWPLGVDLRQKPLYTVKASGTGGETLDGSLIVIDRGLEEVEWWSIYRLGTGQHLFDTYVPLLGFSISSQIVESRYIGLEVPPDNAPDPRLRRPDMVAVIAYSSEERVKREVLLTCDDPKQAPILRSYADSTRRLSLPPEVPPRSVMVSIWANDPARPAPVSVIIPIVNDDLDIAHAQVPVHLHLTAWKR